MGAIDEFLSNNGAYADKFAKGDLEMPPAKQIAVVACMDARLETGALLGLLEGDAHVIRNAGGVVSDDVIRSLTISQRLLGTREIMLIHHTDCGMLTFTDADLKKVEDKIAADIAAGAESIHSSAQNQFNIVLVLSVIQPLSTLLCSSLLSFSFCS